MSSSKIMVVCYIFIYSYLENFGEHNQVFTAVSQRQEIKIFSRLWQQTFTI